MCRLIFTVMGYLGVKSRDRPSAYGPGAWSRVTERGISAAEVLNQGVNTPGASPTDFGGR